MKTNFWIGWTVCLLAGDAVVQDAIAQAKYDLAADFSASQNPNGAWAFGWMAPTSTTFNLYRNPFNAHGLVLQAWRGGVPGDGGSAPPHIILNPTDTPISASDTTWLPHHVTVHPGQRDERSVVRWTSPFAGPVSLTAAFEGRSTFATSGVEIYRNDTRLFSRSVWGSGAASRRAFATIVEVQIGDTIDFRVNYGNGNWESDTTQIEVVISPVPAVAPVPFKWTTHRETITITQYTGSGGAVTIPGTINGLPVSRIEEDAFLGCTSVTSVTIPNSVTRIGNHAFYSCNNLTSVNFQGDAPEINIAVFDNSNDATVYRWPGTRGWHRTFGGRPTVLWKL